MELTLDIFKNDAFSVTSLQRVVDKAPYAPQALGAMRLFEPKPILTEQVLLYEKDGGYGLIPATERGSPWIQQIRRQGRLRALETIALRKQDTLRAGELMGVANAALPENIRLRTAQEITAERTQQLKTDLEATKELHRLSALQGKLLDADGTTVLVNFFTEYGIAEPATVNFDFSAIAENGLAKFIQTNITDPIIDVLKANGRYRPGVTIGALVGDQFWYSLIGHADVVKRWLAMEQVRSIAIASNPLANLPTYDEIVIGNVRFMHYQGSSTGDIDIGVNAAHFFPIGAPDVFNVYWSPGETLNDIQQPGRPEYLYVQPDVRDQMPSHVDFFIAAYPLYACIFPSALLKGAKTG